MYVERLRLDLSVVLWCSNEDYEAFYPCFFEQPFLWAEWGGFRFSLRNSYISMNNGGDFESEGASCTSEAHGSQLGVWIGARAHVFFFFSLHCICWHFWDIPSWRINESSKQSSTCQRYFMLPSQVCHCVARDCHIACPHAAAFLNGWGSSIHLYPQHLSDCFAMR